MKYALAVVALGLAVHFSQPEVVNDFHNCKGFFYRGTKPKGIATGQHVRICQRLQNQYHYATLFDPKSKIPVYSAYKLETGSKGERTWHYEPQVNDSNSEERNMLEYKPGDEIKHQAREEDYKTTIQYNKGHLNPFSHNVDNASTATCTYTNVVPQLIHFNKAIWGQHEVRLSEDLLNKCKDPSTRHVVVGVVQSNTHIGEKHDVNVPMAFWSAYCCSYQNKTGFLSGAFWANHYDNASVHGISLQTLHRRIDPKKIIQIFINDCNSNEQDEGYMTDPSLLSNVLQLIESCVQWVWSIWLN
ncbi:endonuclease domain-containing 1 protein [Amia ocellicauda]|uniref:endonuclease domain-containing 1 protein n=1 Tax=Amia ocellicauda TaxID=2972642 RepID=UPI0034645065